MFPSHQTGLVGCALAIVLCAIPSVTVALHLDFLRDTPVTYLTDADKKLQREAALFVLEHAEANASREWHNPGTGFSGRIEGQGDLISDDGLHCRKLKIIVHAKGGESVFALPLCKGTNGEWFFGSGLKLQPKAERGRVAARPVMIAGI
jgi:hypothetical protein